MKKRHFQPTKAKTAVLLLTGLFLATSTISAMAATSAWTVVSSPNKTNANYLYSVAASSATNAWAVGVAYKSSGQADLTSTLVERWNGSAWSIVPSPSPGTAKLCGDPSYQGNYLYGVATVSSGEAWAVGEICPYGFGETLTEYWDGTKWAVVASPSESGADNSTLAAVASVSSNDVWAVGNYQEGGGAYQWNTLTEHWDGTRWSIVGSPNVAGAEANYLIGVAAVSTTDVWAVGYSEIDLEIDVPLIEHYDGQSWTIIPSPYPPPSEFNGLYAVSAISANDIWATGYENENSSGQYGGALIEHWDGTNWSLVDGPFLGSAINLYGLAAVSSTDIWAVGDAWNGSLGFNLHPITEHWDGTHWALVSAPYPGKAAQLYGVTAVNGTLWTVGAYSATTGIELSNPATLTLKSAQ